MSFKSRILTDPSEAGGRFHYSGDEFTESRTLEPFRLKLRNHNTDGGYFFDRRRWDLNWWRL